MIVSVVIPFFNEARRLPETVASVLAYFKDHAEFELILVDDGSMDRSVAEIEKHLSPSVRLLRHEKNCGKGAAIQTGVLASRGELVLFIDADGSTPIRYFEDLRKAISGEVDIAIGSRALPNSIIDAYQGPVRIFIGKFGNLLLRAILGLRLRDTQCGFKLLKGDVARTLFKDLAFPGWSFDFEILYKAKLAGYTVEEVAVQWKNAPGSKFRAVRDALLCTRDLFLIRLRTKVSR
jgi:dolichyl-phosphate beta-glucosyltransferase